MKPCLGDKYDDTSTVNVPDDDQLEIIHRFASLLIEKSEDLNYDYTATVDEHFWDLI